MLLFTLKLVCLQPQELSDFGLICRYLFSKIMYFWYIATIMGHKPHPYTCIKGHVHDDSNFHRHHHHQCLWPLLSPQQELSRHPDPGSASQVVPRCNLYYIFFVFFLQISGPGVCWVALLSLSLWFQFRV